MFRASAYRTVLIGCMAAFLVPLMFSQNIAPHLFPDTLQIHTETVLSGVNISFTTAGEALRLFGEPMREPRSSKYSRDHKAPVSLHTYEWQRGASQLRITVVGDGNNGEIAVIDVIGERPDAEIGTTGGGLKLGDKLADVRRINHLPLFFGVTLPESWSPRDLTSGSLVLEIDFDKDGRVKHMKLTNQCALGCAWG